jgi:hypothetical protein
MTGSMSWISTLDIHGWGSYGADFSRAVGNIERFIAFGGTVHYGTDLGNGPLPVGLNRRELEALLGARMTPADLIASLRGLLPPLADPGTASVIPGASSIADIHGVADLMRAVIVTT